MEARRASIPFCFLLFSWFCVYAVSSEGQIQVHAYIGNKFLFVPGRLENGSVATGSKQAQGGRVITRAKSIFLASPVMACKCTLHTTRNGGFLSKKNRKDKKE